MAHIASEDAQPSANCGGIISVLLTLRHDVSSHSLAAAQVTVQKRLPITGCSTRTTPTKLTLAGSREIRIPRMRIKGYCAKK